MTTMDLNSDLGESLGAWTMGDDAAMLEIVSSANVACGFHAGEHLGLEFGHGGQRFGVEGAGGSGSQPMPIHLKPDRAVRPEAGKGRGVGGIGKLGHGRSERSSSRGTA